jgi:Ca-activated chloride channel family protein
MRAMARVFLCLLALLASVAPPAAGQMVFRGGVDLVTLGVTVTDRKGNLVTDLTRDEFQVLEDGRPQVLEFFGPAAGPDDQTLLSNLHPGLLLDTSGSMEQDLALARTAAIRFLNLLPTAGDITLVDFDTEVRVTRYPQRDFPRVVERIRGRKARGDTALYDALGVYLDGAAGQSGRPVLVIYSDGIDSRSELTFQEAVDLLKASHATVYAIGLLDHGGSARMDARMKLQTMAETTGGTAVFPASVNELDGFYARILEEIRGQYQLGYASTNPIADGRWRSVAVRVTRPGLKVRTRKGYFAPYAPGRRD